MRIGKNISKFRKDRGLTQEELGRQLGVTNQTVSKWETEISLPDVMLLPKIADVLNISLNMLYGIESAKGNLHISADEFPEAAYRFLNQLFYDNTIMRFTCVGPSDAEQIALQTEALEEGKKLGCISNKSGAVIIKNDFAFIDRDYKELGSEKIFTSSNIAKKLMDLSDKNVRKVLEYEYRTAFENSKNTNAYFFVDETAKRCNLTNDIAEEALDTLVRLGLNETYTDNKSHQFIYIFKASTALYALGIFKLAEMLTDDHVWHIIRDTSIIDDYAFRS